MARKQIAKKTIDTATQTVTFDFSDGNSFTVSAGGFSPEMQVNFLLHGISQKFGDSYSGAENVEEAQAAVTALHASLQEGNWTVRATGNGNAGTTALAEALAAVTGKTVEEANEVLGAMEDAQKTAIRKHPQVAAKLAAIKAERAQAKAVKLAAAASEGSTEGGDLAALLG